MDEISHRPVIERPATGSTICFLSEGSVVLSLFTENLAQYFVAQFAGEEYSVPPSHSWVHPGQSCFPKYTKCLLHKRSPPVSELIWMHTKFADSFGKGFPFFRA